MWLLNTETIRLDEFNETSIKPYAILSHTWGEQEVTFQHITNPDPSVAGRMKGYDKVKDSCAQAAADGFTHIWIDTCCIDKSSSAELSEAINSMFGWYRDAKVCYAYLADVPDDVDVTWASSPFHRSKWFTRGWTLQELLAPSLVYFFTSGWKRLGSKTLLRKQVAQISRVDERILCGEESIFSASVAKRMSWAATRKTTRIEDMAYCLLGIFDVNMPLLYGEGKKAFLRLQEEIIRVSVDQTIFAWGYKSKGTRRLSNAREERHATRDLVGFLADDPSAFRASGSDWVRDELAEDIKPYTMTNLGLRMDLIQIEPGNPFRNPAEPNRRTTNLIVLACRPANSTNQVLAIPIEHKEGDTVLRMGTEEPYAIDRAAIYQTHQRTQRLYLSITAHSAGSSSSDVSRANSWRVDGLNDFTDDVDPLFNVVVRRLPVGLALDPRRVYPTGTLDERLRLISTPSRNIAICFDNKYVIWIRDDRLVLVYEKLDGKGLDFDYAWFEKQLGSGSGSGIMPENYTLCSKFKEQLSIRPIKINGIHAHVLDIVDEAADE